MSKTPEPPTDDQLEDDPEATWDETGWGEAVFGGS